MKNIDVQQLITQFPLVQSLIALEPVTWFNPNATTLAVGLPYVGLDQNDVADASARLARFAPYMCDAFPETRVSKGILESEIAAIPAMQATLNARYGVELTGKLLLKKDSHLPISGSIKARGGIYEVLTHAERLAIKAGLLCEEDDYRKLFTDEFRQFFGQYSIAVGSTGNLGMSIGIMSAKLGFTVTVHMSADAREWKKRKLREHGVIVVEYAEDYGVAVEQGRKEAERDPNCFFIDDENSRTLFLGYSVAGERVKKQFDEMGIKVDAEHPLFVYLPCGVGGGPGGVTFGLKLAFGDAVSCYFAEPTQAPAVILGLITGRDDAISGQDLGLPGKTAADGLAVSRPSALVCRAMRSLVSGLYTMRDDTLYLLLHHLFQTEGIFLEPSALAGFPGVLHVECGGFGPHPHAAQGTHLVWCTGGSLVPEQERQAYLAMGEKCAAEARPH